MWPLQGEALVVANLDQICAGLQKAAPSPVYVPRQRLSRLDALASLYACSVEGRQSQPFARLPAEKRTSLSDMFAATRVRGCFGWVRLDGQSLLHLNREISTAGRREEKGELAPEYFESQKQYYGIVYEYVPPAEFDVDAVQRQIDFFHYAGFNTFQPANKVNWEGPGIRLDFGDFRTPVDPDFEGSSYHYKPTTAWFILDLDYPPPEEKTTAEKEKRLERPEEKRRERGTKARAVEAVYGAKRYATGIGPSEPASEVLPEDAVHEVRVPEIEPPVVRNVWRQNHKLKEEYLAWLAETEAAAAREADGADEGN